MKKVLLSAYACSPIRGSEPNNGWQWVKGLAEKGYDIWCLTNVEDQEQIVKHAKELDLPNLHFVFVPLSPALDKRLLNTSSKTIYLHYLLWQKRAGAVAQKLHLEHNFDIGHHVTFGSLQQGTFLWKLKNIRIVFGPVGGGQVSMPLFKKYFGKDWKIERLRAFISYISFKLNRNLKKTLDSASVILVTNYDTQRLIEKASSNTKGKVHFCPDNAVDESLLQLSPKEYPEHETLKLLWVGRVLPRKGLNLVLEALSHVKKDVSYTLTIVGGDVNFSLIPAWIEEYKLDKSLINIVGQIPYSEVVSYYRNSDAFIFCSLRDSNAVQFNEAMAFGLPVITLDMHGASTAVPDDCGIKVKPTTLEETLDGIADAVRKLYLDKKLIEIYGKNGQKCAKSNTWEAKINNITTNYY